MKPQTQKKSAPREYKCPCGKDYLSYPALFTHIKLKHNGKVHTSQYLGTRRYLKTLKRD